MKYGVYLYGSEAQKTALPESDVDLVFLTTEAFTDSKYNQITKELQNRFPSWKNRKIDPQFIKASKLRPSKSYAVTTLAGLHRRAELIAGEDILDLCFEPTWLDYQIAIENRAQHWIKNTQALNFELFYQNILKLKKIKVLYRLVFAIALHVELEKHPGQWLFYAEEITDPLFRKVSKFARERCHYQMPKDESGCRELEQICRELSSFAQDLGLPRLQD